MDKLKKCYYYNNNILYMLSDFEKVYYDRLLEQIRNKNRVLFCFFKRKNPITMADLAQLKDSVDYVLYGPAKSYEDEKLTEKTDVKAEWISDIVQRNELRKQKLCQRASDCSEERLNFGI